jgi:hypothetical protein
MSQRANIPLEGEFNCWTRDFDLPDLIFAVCETGETGLLRFVTVEAEKTLFIREGRVIFATSSSSDDRLGEYLLRMGKVRLKVLTELSREVKPGKRLGAVLVERGVLEPKDLLTAVVGHIRAMIISLFRWTDGWYGFSPQAASKEAITLDISTADLILAGVRQIDSWRRILKGVGDLGSCYRAVAGREAVVRGMDVDARAVEILAALREPLTVESACARSDLHDFEVCRLLWVYRSVGLIESVDPASLPAPAAPVSESEPVVFSMREPEESAPLDIVVEAEPVAAASAEPVTVIEAIAGSEAPPQVVEAEVVVEPDAASAPVPDSHPFEAWRSASGGEGAALVPGLDGDSSNEQPAAESPQEEPSVAGVEGETAPVEAGDADLEGLGMVLQKRVPSLRGAATGASKK